MIRQAHLCAALSLLLAAVATLLLYQPEGNRATIASGAPEPVIAERVPELSPGSPWIEPPSPHETAPAAQRDSRLARKTFTAVTPGERLQDVARRVYGTADATERLWRANRDTLPGPDSPLQPGMLLRTP